MKRIFITGSLLLSLASFSQIRNNQNPLNNSINTSSAFLDASSSASWNGSTNIGKGLLFPRVDLTTLAALNPSASLPTNNPNRFDGLLVFNTATGTSSIGGVAVTPGFYFYRNTSTNINGGTWTPLGSSAATANKVSAVSTATYAALATDGTLLVDVPSGGATVTLPVAATNNGKILIVKKVDDDTDVLTFNSAVKVTVTESFTTLNYATTLKIQSDGTNWWLIN